MHPVWEKLRGSAQKAAIVLAGVVLAQAILFWPSLSGQKVLLPLDLLKMEGDLIPMARGEKPAFHNWVRSDLSRTSEPQRRFDAGEIHAGRWPMWRTYLFAGSPEVTPRLSPFWLLAISATSPAILAWVQLLTALVAGVGAYVFCRRVLQVGFQPALIAAWCYPLTGFFVFWQGFFIPYNLAWFPWLLLAVDKTVCAARPWAGAVLGGATFLVLVSGQLDVAGQILLSSGLYAVWCWIDQYVKPRLAERFGAKPSQSEQRPRQGQAAAAPILGPALRAASRWPPVGDSDSSWPGPIFSRSWNTPRPAPAWPGGAKASKSGRPSAWPPCRRSSCPTCTARRKSAAFISSVPGQGNQLESSAAAYAGLLATLLVAPLAWCSRRHRSINVFWLILIVLSLAWVLNIPGLVSLLRMRGLNMLSHNRWTFAASLAIVAMMAEGLESLSQGPLPRRAWFWAPAILTAGVFGYCALRTMAPPELTVPTSNGSIALEDFVRGGGAFGWITDLDDVPRRPKFLRLLFCPLHPAGRAGRRRLDRLASPGQVSTVVCAAVRVPTDGRFALLRVRPHAPNATGR